MQLHVMQSQRAAQSCRTGDATDRRDPALSRMCVPGCYQYRRVLARVLG